MSTTIEFKADELKRLLGNGVLFTAPAKDYLPALETVRFDWDGDQLFTVATNRYVLSWEEATPVASEGRDGFSVSVPDAKRIMAMIPSSPFDRDRVTVEYDGDAHKASFTWNYHTMIVSTEEVREFPRYRALIPDADARSEVDTIAIDAKWLALLAKVKTASRGAHVRFVFNGAKPVQVMIGEHFKAIIMPAKNAG